MSVFVSLVTRLLVIMGGFILPGLSTHKYLRHHQHSSPDSSLTSHLLLKHYAVMSVFISFEWIIDWALFWLPFYDEVKCMLVGWLVLPFAHPGSLVIYTAYVDPFLRTHEDAIDRLVQTIVRNVVYSMLVGFRTACSFAISYFTSTQQVNSPPSPDPAVSPSAQLWNSVFPFVISAGASLGDQLQKIVASTSISTSSNADSISHISTASHGEPTPPSNTRTSPVQAVLNRRRLKKPAKPASSSSAAHQMDIEKLMCSPMETDDYYMRN